MVVLAGWILLAEPHRARAVVVLVAARCSRRSSTRFAVSTDKKALRDLPAARRARTPAGQRPVLLMNPKSGGGKVEKFKLVEECEEAGDRSRSCSVPDDDLEALARDVVARGVDVIGMAGGDGSQALVAGIAAEHDLPYVCIPAGTRNHLALDLGVDREDVVGALDAFTKGYERRVDLGALRRAASS